MGYNNYFLYLDIFKLLNLILNVFLLDLPMRFKRYEKNVDSPDETNY